MGLATAQEGPQISSTDNRDRPADQNQKVAFTSLLNTERAQEEAVIRERLATWSLQRLCEEGYTLNELSAYWVENRGRKQMKTVSFQLGPGVVLPENRFEHGTQVLISRLDPLQEKPKRGNVVSRGKSHIRVGVEDVFALDGEWRVDVGTSMVSYDRMIHAVNSLGQQYIGGIKSDKELIACAGTLLADVLLSGFSRERPPALPQSTPGIFSEDMRIRSWAARYMRPNPIAIDGDPSLEGMNSTQKRAIAMMIGERFSLIQGPPGTGKTRTIIETIKVLKTDFAVSQPLLVCTYTNVAVDNLVEGIAASGLKPLRVAYSGKANLALEEHTLEWKLLQHPLHPQAETQAKELEDLSAKINVYRDKVAKSDGASRNNNKQNLLRLQQRFTIAGNRLYGMRRDMMRDIIDDCDVLCTTCITSAASALGVTDFPVVFLDEASMSTEPASLVPLMKGARHVSLIGDHKQLPPIITSPEAKALGLGVSLFERLIEEGRVPSIMLDIQYRMQPSISAFPSLEFYDLGLRDGIGAQEPLNGMRNSVVFIDHAGAESMKDRSRVNWNEAHIVMGVIEELLSSNENLTGHDIGIIAPTLHALSGHWDTKRCS
ncbi:P-loop containing nucleoside triphosphate hydrolase protein [Hymenopellis radicata]|nr:P-loop containing nucleoside triphosphate hydrolase protein [Hymenopellis radicata]